MNAPPGKGNGALRHAPISKKLGLVAAYRVLPVFQAAPLENAVVWEREAARLFGEFWRSGNQKHLSAFAEHVRGMRSYGGSR
jgi:hypothetical protein